MQLSDFIKLTAGSVISLRTRSFLTALGIAVGIASVVLLTSIGEGVHRFVLSEFTQFGTHLISITPGKTTTAGVSGAVISNVRPLSLDDAQALKRIPQVIEVVPVVQGNASVEAGQLSRRTMVLGVGPAAAEVWQIKVAQGRFLPDDDTYSARAFAILGSKLRDELFAFQNPLGQRIRIGNERYRVIGIMESKGQLLGFDLDDAIYIPASKALDMFNRDSLMEIDLLYKAGSNEEEVAAQASEILIAKHNGEDFTITTQKQMLDVLGSVLNILTLAVGALGGISLLVGGIGIFTIMIIAVKERTSEIGLLRAMGATRRQILALFMAEAVTLAGIGGLAGLILGAGSAWLIGFLIPALPTHTPWHYVFIAESLALAIGLLAGILPARRAAKMDPVEALRAE